MAYRRKEGSREYSDADREMARQLVHDMKWWQKIGYFIRNYPFGDLFIVIAVVVFLFLLHWILQPHPEDILNVELYLATPLLTDEPTVFDDYLTDNGYDPDKESISVNITDEELYSSQLFVTRLGVGDMDLAVVDDGMLETFSGGNGLGALDEMLPEDLLDEYSDSLYVTTDANTGQEHVYGILLPEDSSLYTQGYYSDPEWITIPQNAANKDVAVSVVEYMLKQP